MIDTTDMTEKERLELFAAFANEESKAKSERALRGWETRRRKSQGPHPELLGYEKKTRFEKIKETDNFIIVQDKSKPEK